MVASFVFLIVAQAHNCGASRFGPPTAWHGLSHQYQAAVLQTPKLLHNDARLQSARISMQVDGNVAEALKSGRQDNGRPDMSESGRENIQDASISELPSYLVDVDRVLTVADLPEQRNDVTNLTDTTLPGPTPELVNKDAVEAAPYYLQLFRYNLDNERTSVWAAQNWVSSRNQKKRFAVFADQFDFHGKTVLDVGCGQGDFAKYLEARGVVPARLRGIDGMPEFVHAARQMAPPWAEYVVGDFVADPILFQSGWDFIILGGSLSTLEPAEQKRVLVNCWRASHLGMGFNFVPQSRVLSPLPTGAANPCSFGSHPGGMGECLWRMRPAEMVWWGYQQAGATTVKLIDDYLLGDATIIMRREDSLKFAKPPLFMALHDTLLILLRNVRTTLRLNLLGGWY